MRKTEKRRTYGREEGKEIGDKWQRGKVQIETRRDRDRKWLGADRLEERQRTTTGNNRERKQRVVELLNRRLKKKETEQDRGREMKEK